MAKTKKIRDHATELGTRAGATVAEARDKAAPLLADARDRTAPLLAEAREKAAPALHEARDKISTDVLPVLTAAVAAAGAATEDVRGETAKRGKAVAAALKGEVEAPRQSHKLRNLLVLLGLGGLVAFVVKKKSEREPTTAWQSSYTPTPASAGAAGAGTAAGGAHKADDADDNADDGSNDAAGASPDVAAADAAATPHPATTPDNPAETVDVSKP